MKHLDDTTLNLYLDDALGEDERAQVRAHLDTCEACRAELQAMRAVFAAFGAWRAEPIPQDLAPQVLTRIARRPSPALVARGGALLLGAQVATALLILAWVLPLGLPVLMNTLRALAGAELLSIHPDAFVNLSARMDSFALPLPPVALWVWFVALAVIGVVWLVGNRLILHSVERTEASQ